MLIVDILRHGELRGGVKYRGRVDDPLTIKGRQSMDAVWQQLKGNVDAIISSPLSRCADPARDWADEAGISLLIDERLAELHYGAWEGMTSEQIEQAYPGMLKQWREDPTGMRPPGGESPEELRDRLNDWWQGCIREEKHKHLLVISHSGSLRMLLAIALGAPIATTRRFAMPYACWSRLHIEHGKIEPGKAELAFHHRLPGR